MNSGSFDLEPISQNGILVTVALALAAILAILTVIGMLWGARLKRQRKAAEEEEQRRIDDLKADGVEATNTAEGGAPVVSAPAATAEDVGPAGHDASRSTPLVPTPPAPTPPAPTPPAPTPPTASPDAAPTDRTAQLSDEPLVAAAPFDASPASVAADAPRGEGESVAGDVDGDGARSVTILKGLGPKIATRLDELGITRLDQLAWLDDAEAQQLDAQLGVFQGRMERDRWREQARLLASGDLPAYEAQFGKLG